MKHFISVQSWRCLFQRQGYLSCTLFTGVTAWTHMGTSPLRGRCNMTNGLIMSNKLTPVRAHQSNQVLLFTRRDTPWCARLGILKDNVSDRRDPDATAQNAVLTISRVTTRNFCWEALGQDLCWAPCVTSGAHKDVDPQCLGHLVTRECFQKVSQPGWFPRLLGLRFEMESCLRLKCLQRSNLWIAFNRD